MLKNTNKNRNLSDTKQLDSYVTTPIKQSITQKKSYVRDYKNVVVTSANTRSKRNLAIDFTRAMAILFMMVTHAVAIMFSGKKEDSFIIYYIGLFGGYVSFTTFALLSGASSYFSLIQIPNSERKLIYKKKLQIAIRTFQILVAYYILAFVSAYTAETMFHTGSNLENIKEGIKILVFLRVPDLTEFLLAFILFNVCTILFRRVLKFVSSDYKILFPVSLLVYLAGDMLNNQVFDSSRLNLYKALFAGHATLHYFPILQYLPVFLFGLYYAKLISTNSQPNENHRTRKLSYLSAALLISSTLSVLAYIFTLNRIFDYSVFVGRFPPTLSFILISTTFVLILLTILEVFQPRAIAQKISSSLSKNTLLYLLIHTLFLFLFSYFESKEKFTWDYSDPKYFAIGLVTLFLATSLVIIIINILITHYKKLDAAYTFLNYLLTLFALLLIIATLSFLGFGYLEKSSQKFNISESDLSRQFEVDSSPEKWFDDRYKFYREIRTNDVTSDQIFISQQWGKFEFNHKEVITKNNIGRVRGEDFRVVKLSQNSFSEIPIIIENPNSDKTIVSFKFERDENLKYYIYYAGNSKELSKIIEEKGGIENAIRFQLGDAVEHKLPIETNRKWFLRAPYSDNKLTVTVDTAKTSLKIQDILYEINGTNQSGKLTKNEDGKYTAEIDPTNFEPGEYTIQIMALELSDNLSRYKSYQAPFIVTYPIYTSWTIDWEGYGVFQGEMDDIADISTKYGMPITHFFNPRIYVKDQFSTYAVNESFANYLTYWVLQRRDKGDEIALHLHFYPDLLKEIGVDKIDSAQIVGINRDETAISAYSEEDLEKIINWSLDKFKEKGLGKPVSFRSGAWMSAPQVLKALQNTGFLLDSSGRTGGILNPAWQGSTQIPWNLPATVRPYLPSVYDINSWSGERLSIWEFANNGADSYWFSADELKARFNSNFPGAANVAVQPQSIVYLSHPHGFTVYDTQKIRGLFDYTGQYKYEADKGPVVYSTLENIYNHWEKEKYFNGQ